ncbi:MAG TPA: GDYXXLXY domain-containing protein [Candidatus Moranbacteria bacterium]|nr:GDYXXLXY domain-containing protein [Candidatus Moranbacteria bacterium]
MKKIDKNSALKLLAVVLVQLFIVFSLGAYYFSIHQGGEIIRLEIEPVDPTDLIRGDYVVFSYRGISRIYLSEHGYSEESFRLGDNIYVSLVERSDGVSQLGEVSKEKPESGVFLTGRVKKIRQDTATVIYGIEEYFIPERTGRMVEFRGKKVEAEVAVSKTGKAVLREIYLNGEVWPGSKSEDRNWVE